MWVCAERDLPAARRGGCCREDGLPAGRLGGAAQQGGRAGLHSREGGRAAQQGGWAGCTAGRVGGAAQQGGWAGLRMAGAAQQGGWAGLQGGWVGFLLSFPDSPFLSPDCILPALSMPSCPQIPSSTPISSPSYLQIVIIGPDHCPGVIVCVCVCGEGLG